MTKLFLFCALCAVPLVFGADKDKPPRPGNVETRLVHLQHADPKQVRDLLVNTGAQVSWDDVLRVLVISGTPADVASLEQTAKQIDAESARVSQSDVVLTVYMIGASDTAKATGPLPADMQSTVDQLKQLFPYQSYQLLETALVRGRVGQQSRVGGRLQPVAVGDKAVEPAPYELGVNFAGTGGTGASRVIRVTQFGFHDYSQSRVGIDTDFEIPVGKKVVVGKAGSGNSNAIFLVVEAKVAD